MRAARWLVEHLTSRVRGFRLSGDFGDDRTLHDISQYETGVAMCPAGMPRRIIHVTDGHLPAVQRDVRQIVFENGTRRRLRLTLGRGSGYLREKGQSPGYCLSTSSHGEPSYRGSCLVPWPL